MTAVNITLRLRCVKGVKECLRSISDLKGREVMVNQKSQSTNGDDQELHSERVVVPVISCLELQIDQVHGGVRTSNVDDLRDTDNIVQIMKDKTSLVRHEYKSSIINLSHLAGKHHPSVNTGVSTWCTCLA